MNIDQSLSANGLQRIRQLAAGHPVFLLTYQDGACVIKADSAGKNKLLKDPIEIMNAIDPHARSRVLGKQELMAIKGWASGNAGNLDEKTPGYLITELGKALLPPLPPMAGQRTPVSQQQSVFIVMPAKQQLMDLKEAGSEALGLDADGHPTVRDKGKVRQLADVFKQHGTLEKLGNILAVDAFNGNQDRINFQDNVQVRSWHGQPMRRMQNIGNFFVGEGGDGRLTVLGLDVFDPVNQFQDFDRFAETDFDPFPGRALRPDAKPQRQKLAQDVAADLETVLGPRNRKLGFLKQTRLPNDAAIRIERGLDDGAKKILAYLKAKYANGGIPIAISQRLQACGWMSRINFPKL
ncbi:hypothetical protein LuPra_00444 [Luteitalea pratensis]|uniref:Uncharacterized protein n=1 Tax=Luteitalea pratensis TaxID=1855912 RepID=A0A143PFG3_LUTPR|nr:hypothetical protein [Luteitalea pratensis]AMY07277.1 hypothetical protein LuPra_00444 [Luteitalea pratensis]